MHELSAVEDCYDVGARDRVVLIGRWPKLEKCKESGSADGLACVRLDQFGEI
jgi:hypothetical protein